jgi:hypothetical protein
MTSASSTLSTFRRLSSKPDGPASGFDVAVESAEHVLDAVDPIPEPIR